MLKQNFLAKNTIDDDGLFAKVLLVDTDLAFGEKMCAHLTNAGYNSKLITETDNIIPIMNKFKPDIVLLAYLLPIVNGGELCMQIKNSEKFKKIPVLIYTSYPEILWSVKYYGCDALIAKPFEAENLLLKIEKLLANSKEAKRYNLLPNSLKNRLRYLDKFLRY